MSELRRITEQYRLDKLVRASAAASVFRATDLRSGAAVAVKLVTEGGGAESEAQRERFRRTARRLQVVAHPAVPHVLDFGFTTLGNAFLVSELLYGTTLEVFTGSPAPRVLALLLQAVDGLEAMAQAGVAHGNLRLDNLLVTPAAEGEQVKLLGLGTAALRPGEDAEAPEGRRSDLRALAIAIGELLGIGMPVGAAAARIHLPRTVAGVLHDPEALQGLLQDLLREDGKAAPPAYEEVRAALRRALSGGGWRAARGNETATAARAAPAVLRAVTVPAPPAAAAPRLGDDATTVVMPPAAPTPRADDDSGTLVLDPSAAPLPTARMDADAATAELPVLRPSPWLRLLRLWQRPWTKVLAALRSLRLLRQRRWIAVAAAVPLALLLAALTLWSLGDDAPQAGAQPAGLQASADPSSPLPAAAPRRAERTALVHPQIELAEARLAAGDREGAWAAIPGGERERFSAGERDRYQRLADTVAAERRERLAGELAAALRAGDLPRLRAAAAALDAEGGAGLAAAARRDLERARRAVDLGRQLTRAERAGDWQQALARAGELLQLLPSSAATAAARERAAAALEADAEAATGAGRPDAALALLQAVEAAWPESPGLAERRERAAAEGRSSQKQEAALAAAALAEEAGRPLDGLRALGGATPTARFEARFGEARERLQALLARLDGAAPAIAARGTLPAEYEKDAAIHVALRITDDHEVAAVELWCRPEGGTYAAVPLARRSITDYDADIPPTVHQNKPLELYVVATDHSGHQGQLGSAESPLRIKRKRWWQP